MSAGAAPAAGRLLLMPSPLDHGGAPVPIDRQLPLGVLREAAAIGHWIAENARSARALLKRVHAVVPLARPLQAIEILELPRPRKGAGIGEPVDHRPLLRPALAGHDLGLLSEAGLPAVADPGAELVAAAHAAGIAVVPLPGPSALLLALAASGLNGQGFAFVGYLPQEAEPRRSRIRELQATSRRLGQTQLMIETPYRNAALLHALIETLDGGTRLAVACGLTLPGGWTRSEPVARWRARPPAMPADVPAVFALLG